MYLEEKEIRSMPGGKGVPAVMAVVPLSLARVRTLIPRKVWFSMNTWLLSATVCRDERSREC